VERRLLSATNNTITSNKLVFSKWPYLLLTSVVSAAFWIIFSVFDQLLFFSPFLAFHIPNDAITDFVLSNIIAVLLGAVTTLNVYAFKHVKRRRRIRSAIEKKSRRAESSVLSSFRYSLLSGSSIGIISSMCAGCSSIGLYLSMLLAGGGAAVGMSTAATNVMASALISFLDSYYLPLRFLSVMLLFWAYYAASRTIAKSCILRHSTKNRTTTTSG
jgi:hypothetical protein